MKGNLFLGHGRGAVGDIVFSRVRGQQIARARNRQPHDRKSYSQEGIRASFSSAAKFFSLLPTKLLQFAFEFKGGRSSDYNAFIKANYDKGCMLTAEQFSDPTFFPYGEFVTSAGSLRAVQISSVGDENLLSFPGSFQAGLACDTWGELSDALIAEGGYQTGDFLTFCYVSNGLSNSQIESMDFLQPCPSASTLIKQLIVDASDTRSMESIGFLGADSRKGAIDLVVDTLILPFDWDSYGMFVIHSRKVKGGVLSSDSMIKWSGHIYSKAIDVMTNPNYEREIKRARGARNGGILDGSYYE